MTDSSADPILSPVDIPARLAGSLAAIEGLRNDAKILATIGRTVTDAFANGRRLYTAGNGGSSAQALHLAEELIGRYRSDRPAVPAICLNADVTALTCITNDYGYDRVFARQCEALLQPGDVLVVFSTSGNSANLVAALDVARDKGAITVGLLGRDGGACRERCDHVLLAAGDESSFIQDAHQVVLHLMCEYVEGMFGNA